MGDPVRSRIVFGAIALSLLLVGTSQSSAQERGPVVASPAPTYVPGTNPYAEVWTGFGGTRTFFGGYVGGNVALNPTHSVWDTGFLLRGEGQVGQYRHTDVDTDDVLTHGATVMLGYRVRMSDSLLTGYVGANYETHDNDDRHAVLRGTEVGFKALIEYYTRINPGVDFYGQASYSTAFDTAFAFSRIGFNVVRQSWTGPEFSFYRNGESEYRETRLGWFVRFDDLFPGVGVSVAGGIVNDLSTPDKFLPNNPWYASASLYFILK
jgi:hypothetical protein